MKTLIVTTDFSEEAENAMEYAGAIASKFGAKIVLFNSFSIPLHTANTLLPADSIEQLQHKNDMVLKARALKLSKKYSIEVGYESRLLLLVSEELEDLVRKYKADLIIMGMAAKSLAQDIFGNTTTSAIMKLRFPVLAVPKGVTFTGIRRILFACDVMRGVQKKILSRVREIAGVLNAEVEIFHVQERLKNLDKNKTHALVTDEIDEGLEGIAHYYKNVESGAVIKEIEKEIKAIDADLLIMIPHKYGFWESLIHRSKTRIMASNGEIPLLSIPV